MPFNSLCNKAYQAQSSKVFPAAVESWCSLTIRIPRAVVLYKFSYLEHKVRCRTDKKNLEEHNSAAASFQLDVITRTTSM